MPTDRRNAAQKLDEDGKPSAIAIAPTPSSAASMRFACAICRSTTNAPTEQPRAVRKLRGSWRTETPHSSARSCSDRKSGGQGKSVSVRGDLGGRRCSQKKRQYEKGTS